MPAAALADKPAEPVEFEAKGALTSISAGQVIQMPKTGLWRIAKREMTGMFIGGDITGEFTATFRGLVNAMQAGDLSGKLEIGPYKMLLEGQSLPLEMVPVPFPNPEDPNGPPIIVDLPQITLTGTWEFTAGAHGEGGFVAYAIFVPTPDGQHVDYIVASEVTFTGLWRSKNGE